MYLVERIGNVVFVRPNGPATDEEGQRVLDACVDARVALGGRRPVLVCVLGAEATVPSAEERRAMDLRLGEFAAATSYIAFVMELRGPVYARMVGFFVATMWSLRAPPTTPLRTHDSVTAALAASPVPLDLPISMLVSRAREAGAVRATRGVDAAPPR